MPLPSAVRRADVAEGGAALEDSEELEAPEEPGRAARADADADAAASTREEAPSASELHDAIVVCARPLHTRARRPRQF